MPSNVEMQCIFLSIVVMRNNLALCPLWEMDCSVLVFKDKLPNNCFKPFNFVCLVGLLFFQVISLPLPVSKLWGKNAYVSFWLRANTSHALTAWNWYWQDKILIVTLRLEAFLCRECIKALANILKVNGTLRYFWGFPLLRA